MSSSVIAKLMTQTYNKTLSADVVRWPVSLTTSLSLVIQRICRIYKKGMSADFVRWPMMPLFPSACMQCFHSKSTELGSDHPVVGTVMSHGVSALQRTRLTHNKHQSFYNLRVNGATHDMNKPSWVICNDRLFDITCKRTVATNMPILNIIKNQINNTSFNLDGRSMFVSNSRSFHTTSYKLNAGKTVPGLNIHVALLNLSEYGGRDNSQLNELRRFQFQGKSLQDMMSLTEMDWEAMVDFTQLDKQDIAIYEAHKKAVAVGERFYEDPKTGYIVMTRMAHMKRGTCCGNACRHCPFGHVAVNPALRDKFKFNSAFFH